MAALTQGLPVFFIPEKFRVTPVWFDVVDDRRGRQSSLGLAADTPRMPAEIPCPCLLPSPVVATLGCRPSVMAVFPSMYLAVLLPVRYELRTARMRAGRLRSMRHRIISSSIMAGTAGLEPTPTVLETVMLPITLCAHKKSSCRFLYKSLCLSSFSL